MPVTQNIRRQSLSDLDQQLQHEAQLAAEAIPGVRAAFNEAKERGKLDDDLKFSLALLLVKSSDPKDNKQGLLLLRELVGNDYHITDCFYSMGLGLYRMEHFDESRQQIEMLLRIDPDHAAADRLHRALLDKIARRDQVMGITTVAGFAVAGVIGVVASMVINSSRRR